MNKAQEKKHSRKKHHVHDAEAPDLKGTERASDGVSPAEPMVDGTAGAEPLDKAPSDGVTEQTAVPEGNGLPPDEAEVRLSRQDYEAMKAAAEDRDRVFEQLQRSVAEFENYQKRIKRDKAQSEERKLRLFVMDLLPVLDDLGRIRSALDQSLPVEEIRKVMDLFSDKISAVLGNWQIERIAAEGQDFDPNFHDALRQEPTDAMAPGKVLNEVSSGYTLKGAVLKAAQVIVACAQPSVDGGQAPDIGADAYDGDGAEPPTEGTADKRSETTTEKHPSKTPEA